MDNLQTLLQTIIAQINTPNGIDSITPEIVQAILRDIVTKVGRFTGIPLIAKGSGTITAGSVIWNNNPMSSTSDFTINISNTTADGTSAIVILSRINAGDIIHIKDFEGRSGFYLYKSQVINTDNVELTLQGFAGNNPYTYLSSDAVSCIMEVLPIKSKTVPFGNPTVYKTKGNTADEPEINDFVVGPINGNLMMLGGILIAVDNIMDISNYNQETSFWRDMNDI